MIITDEHLEELIGLIKQFTAIPAPSHHEEKRVSFLVDVLEGCGYRAIIDDALNVIVEFNIRPETKDIILCTAHTDTVFPDTEEIIVREDEENLYAPGVGDDTANASAMLYYLFSRPAIKAPVAFVFDTCEEGLGNLKGMKAVYKRYAGRLKCHYAFDGSTDHIVNRAVGSDRYEVTVTTKGGHSYNNYGNENAIRVASEYICKLYDIATDDLPGKATKNVGTITGGTSVNTIAQEVHFMYEYRADNMDALGKMKERTASVLGMELPEEGETRTRVIDMGEDRLNADIRVKLLGHRPGQGDVDSEKQEALNKQVSDLLFAETGVIPTLDSGSTDCNITLSNCVPAVCFGIYLGAGQHTREEWINKASMKSGLQALWNLLDIISE